MMNSTKVIITNKTALLHKYGKDGYELIEAEIHALIHADRMRFITDTLVCVDDVRQMQLFNGSAVTSVDNEEENKRAVDAVCEALSPDYVTLLGATDVIPMQLLDNPADEDDLNVPSDLPYACDASYGTSISDFLSPSRVVGRIPDIPGATTPEALLAALNTAVHVRGMGRRSFNRYFAVSTEVWKASTSQSITNIAGHDTDMYVSHAEGPNWAEEQYLPPLHFVNCHGSMSAPNWYGRMESSYPVAVDPALLDGKITPNTIGAAECCYGARLDNPGGICTAYLTSGMAAFCGSTNIAYAPTSGQGYADLITQYFLIQVLGGSSVGSAMLEARQKYINEHRPMNVYDLKTVAQFNLLGDASAHPVIMDNHAHDPAEALRSKALMRTAKRRNFVAFSRYMRQSVRVAEISLERDVSEEIMALAEEQIGKVVRAHSYGTADGVLMSELARRAGIPEQLIYVLEGERVVTDHFTIARNLIVRESGGEIVSFEVVESR